jgi:hypothetical protein
MIDLQSKERIHSLIESSDFKGFEQSGDWRKKHRIDIVPPQLSLPWRKCRQVEWNILQGGQAKSFRGYRNS